MHVSQAQISFNYTPYFLGVFQTEEEAAVEYARAHYKLFGGAASGTSSVVPLPLPSVITSLPPPSVSSGSLCTGITSDLAVPVAITAPSLPPFASGGSASPSLPSKISISAINAVTQSLPSILPRLWDKKLEVVLDLTVTSFDWAGDDRENASPSEVLLYAFLVILSLNADADALNEFVDDAEDSGEASAHTIRIIQNALQPRIGQPKLHVVSEAMSQWVGRGRVQEPIGAVALRRYIRCHASGNITSIVRVRTVRPRAEAAAPLIASLLRSHREAMTKLLLSCDSDKGGPFFVVVVRILNNFNWYLSPR